MASPKKPLTATNATAKLAVAAAKKLNREVAKLDFREVVPWVYNPLDYAWLAHEQYLLKYARPSCRVLFLGMNPGPWGMAQSGIPFGEIAIVKDWLKIDAVIKKPTPEHPKRPVEGLACGRSEVSGRRLWGLFRERFPNPDDFFETYFVTNYCPLVFMEESARNVTPDKLPAESRAALERVCDQHILQLAEALAPEWIVGVGAFAEKCARRAVEAWPQNKPRSQPPQVGRVLHPSPASPAANRDWAGTAAAQLSAMNVW